MVIRMNKSGSSIFRRITLLFSAVLAILFTITTFSGAITIPRNYDILHIKLNFNFNIKEKSFTATENLKFVPLIDSLSKIILNARDMEIRSVKLFGKNLSFRYDSSKLEIDLPDFFSLLDTLELTIRYFSIPQKGIHFMPVRSKKFSSIQIYSHSEPEDARFWFPSYDAPLEKVTSEIVTTVPDSFFCLSNGKLIHQKWDRRNHLRTFHWLQDKPHSIYLISLVAGKYAEIRDKSGKTPLYYYVYPYQRPLAKLSFGKTPKMIRFFEKTFRYPYPWDKYAQIIVHNYEAAGMEHTSATTLTDRTIYDKRASLDRSSDNLVSHELSHQWFGNLVTCRDWSHLWLNEGFATYAEILFTEYDKGKDDADYAHYLDLEFYLDMADEKFPHPIVYEGYHTADDMFDFIEYQKAGLVLHMLRELIGDAKFFEILHQFLVRFAYQCVETDDFQNLVEEITGKDWDWFFQQWLYSGGHPRLKIFSRYKPTEKNLYLFISQTQEDTTGIIPKVFQFPVEIEVIGKKATTTKKFFIESREDTISIKFPERPVAIRFDKTNYLLKDMEFFQPEGAWLYLAQHDPTVPGRLRAIDEIIDEINDTVKVAQTLEELALSDAHYSVRKEAVYALGDLLLDRSENTLVRAARDSNSHVRRAAVNSLSYYFDKKFNPLFRKIARNDSSYQVIEAALFALSNVKDDSTFNFVSRFVDMESHNDVIRTAAFYVLSFIDDERGIPIGFRFASDTTNSPFIRSLAMNLFKDVGTDNPEVESFLLGMLKDKNKIVLKKTIDLLGYFKNERVLAELEKLKQEKLPSDVEHKVDFSIRRIKSALKRKSK